MDKDYIAILSDVAIKFSAYTTYKTKEGALKVLIKKSKMPAGFPHAENLELAFAIYHKAAELITSGNYTDRSQNTTIYCDFKDIRFTECVTELKKQVPNSDDDLIHPILNWVIFWYYLK